MWPFSSEASGERDLSSLDTSYDYVVVGSAFVIYIVAFEGLTSREGGTAGCVLARRLSDNGDYTVLLIEKGDAGDSWLHRARLTSIHHFSDRKHSTVFPSAHDKELNRSVSLIAGLGLGGSTRINGCMYTCGTPGEYNAWAQEGNNGWGYQELKPFFKKSETWIGPEPREFHGADGPLQVRSFEDFAYRPSEEMYRASERLGFGGIDDFHSPLEPSFGCNKIQFTVGADGTRSSAFRAYLPHELLFATEDDNVRATGVVVQRVDGSMRRTISARREVMLTCGALITPQLLMLSGVGSASHLEDMGIKTVVDLPGIGSNLLRIFAFHPYQDHIILPTTYYCPFNDSLWSAFIWPPALIRELYRYVMHGSGWFLSTLVDCELFGISSLVSEDGTPLPHTKEQEDPHDPRNLADFAILSTGIADPTFPGASWTKGL
ncbi:hypothetical protein EIP91_004231, partial [Steccherinum ochraceum]